MSRKFLITGLTSAAIVATMGIAYAQSQDESALANTNINGTQNSLGHDQAGPPAMPADAAAMSATYGSSYDEQGRLAVSSDTGSAMSAPAGGDMNTDNSASTSANMGAVPSEATTNVQGTQADGSVSATGSEMDPSGESRRGADRSVGTDMNPFPSSAGSVSFPEGNSVQGNSPEATAGARAATSAPAATTSSSATTAESRVDLNSPNDPLYNVASDPVGNNFREGQSSAGNTSNWNGSDNSAASGDMRAPRADRN